ncbi:MAG: hypothetical protein OZ921_12640 [Sorangiineae bacterium]|nr:hypothetical protein [Polyangiaceae bacterium]MEB2323354.1 hypothetical protein [Sorangiineae bacterium]
MSSSARPRVLALMAFLAGALVASCGGDDFTVDEPAGGAAGSANTAGAGGGDAGAAGTGGSAGIDGGGASCEGQPCRDGEYCGEDRQCHLCGELSRFEFDPPEPFDVINAKHQGSYLRYPRAAGERGLLYTVGNWVGNETAIWFTPDPTTSAGHAMPAPLDTEGVPESGPLSTRAASEGMLAGINVFWDRGTRSGSLNRELVGGVLNAAGQVTSVAPLGAPINVVDTNNFGFAFAPLAARAWWISSRKGALNLDLFTASVGPTSPATAAQVNLVTEPASCPSAGLDAAPWVTPDGRLLLFTSAEYYGDCSSKGSTQDLYAVGLDEHGQATGFGRRLNINLQNVYDVQPSLSPDLCSLYFSSNRDGANQLRLYRARRK